MHVLQADSILHLLSVVYQVKNCVGETSSLITPPSQLVCCGLPRAVSAPHAHRACTQLPAQGRTLAQAPQAPQKHLTPGHCHLVRSIPGIRILGTFLLSTSGKHQHLHVPGCSFTVSLSAVHRVWHQPFVWWLSFPLLCVHVQATPKSLWSPLRWRVCLTWCWSHGGCCAT
jgi:hypothetical protein